MPVTVTIGEATNWTSGEYLAYLAPWGAGSLVAGQDYSDTLTLSPDIFPNGVTIAWSWPETAAPFGVYNFDAIDFGNYNGTVVQTPIQALRVNAIGTLTQHYDLTLGGDVAKYDVITDFFLTSNAGDLNTKLFEVEIFEHTPAYSQWYVEHVTQLGTYTDAGSHSWTVALHENAGLAPDILIMPSDASDKLSGALDIKAMLDWLVLHGVITGNEYFNGLGLGAEVHQGSGSLAINTFSVDYSEATSPSGPVSAPSTANGVTDLSTGGPASVSTSNSEVNITTTPPAVIADSSQQAVGTPTANHDALAAAASAATVTVPALPVETSSLLTATVDSGVSYASAQASTVTTQEAQAVAVVVTTMQNNDPPTHDVFRFYDTVTNDHFYTTDPNEAATIQANIKTLSYENTPWSAPEKGAGTIDVFRFYDTATKTHFLTDSAAERDTILTKLPTFTYEGVAFQAYADMSHAGSFALERFFNTISGVHTYAADASEIALIKSGAVGQGWIDEGASFIVHAGHS